LTWEPRLPLHARAVLVAVGLTLAACHQHHDGLSRPDGTAFDSSLSGVSTTQPIKNGSFAIFGSVVLRNVSGRPMHLLRASPVWSENVIVSNIGISPYGPTVPISSVDVHAVDAVGIAGFVVPPSRGPNDELYGITIELRPKPGREVGLIVGLDVSYQDDHDVQTQRFPLMNLVCPWVDASPEPCATTYQGVQVFNADPRKVLDTFLARDHE
jgi:hypothetical protein